LPYIFFLEWIGSDFGHPRLRLCRIVSLSTPQSTVTEHRKEDETKRLEEYIYRLCSSRSKHLQFFIRWRERKTV